MGAILIRTTPLGVEERVGKVFCKELTSANILRFLQKTMETNHITLALWQLSDVFVLLQLYLPLLNFLLIFPILPMQSIF